MQFTTVALAALMGLASAQNVHVVSVGGTDGSPKFSPDNIKAQAGEMIQFQFRGGNHSVVQSNFDNPCTPISQHTNQTGVFSGYQSVKDSEAMGMVPTYTIMIADTKPLWFYCSQAKHCQNGMTMVVNENTAANASRSLVAHKELAKGVAASIIPGSAAGGNVGSTTPGSETTPGSGAGESGIPVAAGSLVGVSSTLGLVSIAAALLML